MLPTTASPLGVSNKKLFTAERAAGECDPIPDMRLVHDYEQIPDLLRARGLGHARLVVCLPFVLSSKSELAQLTKLLRRKDVQLIDLRLNLNSAVDAESVRAFLTEVQVHHMRQPLMRLALQVDGSNEGPIPQHLREVVAQSAVCLALGGFELRYMLFGSLFERYARDYDPQSHDDRVSFRSAVAAFSLVEEDAMAQDLSAQVLDELFLLALQEKDKALLLAVCTLAQGKQLPTVGSPDASQFAWLEGMQQPYQLRFGALSDEEGKQLGAVLAQNRPGVCAIELLQNGFIDPESWEGLLKGMLGQADLTAVRVSIHDSREDDKPVNILSTKRLRSLMVIVHALDTGKAVELIRCLKPEQLALMASPQQVVCILKRLNELNRLSEALEGSAADAFDISSLQVSWSSSDGPAFAEESAEIIVKSVFKEAKALGLIYQNGAWPRTPQGWNQLTNEVEAQYLALRQQPGPSFGMHDQAETSPLLFHCHKAHWLGAAEAVMQHVLLKKTGVGPLDVAGQLIAQRSLTVEDFRALACVNKAGHLGGQVADIFAAMNEGRLSEEQLRRRLSLSSGQLDHELIAALRERLGYLKASQGSESMRHLFDAATAL